jgi:PKHD-type hydroxylase
MVKAKKLSSEISHDWWLEIGSTESWAYIHNVFTDQEIEEIKKIAKKYSTKNGKVGSGKNTEINDTIRNSDICFLPSTDTENHWIFQRLSATIIDMNRQFWNFELNRIETLQYTVYSEGQFYGDHIDMMFEGPNRATRKLSFTVQLTDPDEYEGGDLEFKLSQYPVLGKREKGAVIFFPSYVLHGVTKVTKGTRHSLVGWVTGPAFK